MTFHQLVERGTDGQTRQVDKGSLSPDHFSNHFNATVWWSRHLDKSVFNFTRPGPLFNGKWFHPFLTSVATSQNWLFLQIWLWPPRNVPLAKSDLFHGTFRVRNVDLRQFWQINASANEAILAALWSVEEVMTRRFEKLCQSDEINVLLKGMPAVYDPAKFRKSLLSLRT